MPRTEDTAATGREKVALTNVRIFDGTVLRSPSTVVIDGDTIGADPGGARVIDCAAMILLPGLIDAHVHVEDLGNLTRLTDFGVTTALDMAAWPRERIDALRHRPGRTDIRTAGIPATAPGSAHSALPGFPAAGVLSGPEGAEQFVEDRIAEGADYIKLVADIPGPDQATLDALVVAARGHGKLTVAHAVSAAAYAMAVAAGADVVTHAPLDAVVAESVVARMVADGRVVVPTLTMMAGIVERFAQAAGGSSHGAAWSNYDAARDSVTAMYRAGVPILAGTDANVGEGTPATPSHGDSLHHELELLVEAGVTTVDALRAATSLPAEYFGLGDRGVIEPGRRADLVLVDGDPVNDIRDTRNISRIWCGGIEHHPAESSARTSGS
ncbi:putative amidohydrolase [Nocardia nova SH22a]|uniref:Putative amidohydrolase n=1 Tax=Nocardia nova SH22a TaxID=1415166 RepID=W5TMW0_9NOCA|nr:amidohydrolase family protein [Nocardia nova]AHH18576.1 putative amidohydrolase [Nocardia nova SH22a]